MHAVNPWRSNDLSLFFFEVSLSLFLCGVCVHVHVGAREREKEKERWRDNSLESILYLGHYRVLRIYI